MKKNVNKTKAKKTKKSNSWISVLVAFVLGAVFGAFIYANHNMFVFRTDATCVDGSVPDKNGCCTGEVYTDMGDLGYNCCPESGGDCFPPLR